MAKSAKGKNQTAKPDTQDVAVDAATGGSVDAIRDIIFGAQMKDYDQRFSALEQRLIKDSTDLRKQMEQRLDRLEADMQKRHEEITNTIQTAVAHLTSVKTDRSLLSKLLVEMASKIDDAT